MHIIKNLGVLLSILFALPFVAGAAYNDVSLTSDAVISVNSLSIGISSNSATAIESMTVNSTDFTVTIQANSTFLATSSNRATFSVEAPSPLSQTKTCTAAESGITLSGASAGMTVTISPSSTACDASPSSSSSSSSGSSGGGGIVGLFGVVNTNTASESPVPATVPQVAIMPVTTETGAVVPKLFTKTMSVGSHSDEVTGLQQFLAKDPAVFPEGIISGYFGQLTERAIQKFQVKYGIVSSGLPGYGSVGPKTRAKLNELMSATSVSVPAIPSATPKTMVSGSFAKPLSQGVSDAAVVLLQQILNRDPDTKIAENGAGSPGNETNYFGSATLRAVQKFQEKYGLAGTGDPGYGYVGPKTRAKLNELSP